MGLFGKQRNPEPTVPGWVINELRHINRRLGDILMSLADLQAKADATLAQVTSDTDLNTSIAKVVNDYRAQVTDLKAQLAAAIAAGADPAALQGLSDTLDHILSLDTSNSKIVSDAITANTPAPAPPATGDTGGAPVPQPQPDK